LKKVLVIAPHPDDETLGCGGTLIRHKLEGDKIYWLIVTGIKREDGWASETIESRKKQIELVSTVYSCEDIFDINLPTMKVDNILTSELVDRIAEIHRQIEPDIIYMPFVNDVHSDHQLIAKAVQANVKWFRFPYVKEVLSYETLSETDFNFIGDSVFRPNVFVDISNHINEKIQTMKIYKNEIGEHPFPRSERAIRALSTLRGAQSGFDAAEAFQMVYLRR
jgi:N-acetylglucosamine malate deacetylase 1